MGSRPRLYLSDALRAGEWFDGDQLPTHQGGEVPLSRRIANSRHQREITSAESPAMTMRSASSRVNSQR